MQRKDKVWWVVFVLLFVVLLLLRFCSVSPFNEKKIDDETNKELLTRT